MPLNTQQQQPSQQQHQLPEHNSSLQIFVSTELKLQKRKQQQQQKQQPTICAHHPFCSPKAINIDNK